MSLEVSDAYLFFIYVSNSSLQHFEVNVLNLSFPLVL